MNAINLTNSSLQSIKYGEIENFKMNLTDELIATVSQPGQSQMTLRFIGEKSIETIISKIRSLTTNIKGIIYLSIRNLSQGWTIYRKLVKAGIMSINISSCYSTLTQKNSNLNAYATNNSSEHQLTKQLIFEFN